MRLTAYGHSWVAGDGASRPSRRFVDLAAWRLGYVPTNLGAGGSSSPDTAALVSREPAPASAMYVVMTGLNDARLHGASPDALEAYAEALQTIFSALSRASPAALTIAAEQPHLLDYSLHAPHDRGTNEILDAYNQQLSVVAGRHPRVVVATVSGWDPTAMLSADTVHPNDAGHAAVAGAVERSGMPRRRPPTEG